MILMLCCGTYNDCYVVSSFQSYVLFAVSLAHRVLDKYRSKHCSRMQVEYPVNHRHELSDLKSLVQMPFELHVVLKGYRHRDTALEPQSH